MSMIQASAVFGAKMVDLGAYDVRFRGVLMPESEVGSVPKGVTTQFTDEAAIYHKKYFDTDYTDWLLRNTLERVPPLPKDPVVLDIGSGSGPTVLSLLKLIDGARIVAADVSPDLLSLLRRALDDARQGEAVTTVCVDLNKSWFHEERFDFAIGSAILHHLFDPALLIDQVFRAMKPGASLAFYEPFEPGNAMLALVLRQIIDAARARKGIDPVLVDYFEYRIQAVRTMRCEAKPVVEFANIDDKWMFTRSYFERVSRRIGAEAMTIYPISRIHEPFREAISTWLRLAFNRRTDALPRWVWDIVDEAEKALSEDCREDMLMAGCVIFRKPASPEPASA